MKKVFRSYQLLILLSSVLPLFGACSDSERCVPWYKYIQTDVGINFNYARYKLGKLSKISGYLAGVHCELEFKKPCHVLVGIYFDGQWNAGHLCSKTDLCNPSDVRSKVADYIVDLHAGYNWAICSERFLFTPFAGVGFYHLSKKLAPDVIRYKYHNVFIPVGFELDWCVNDCFDIGLRAEYRIDAYTRLKLSIPCIKVCEKLKLKRSHGVKVEIPMTWYYDASVCGKRSLDMNCKVIPFFDWNKFGAAKQESNCLAVPVPKLKRWHLGLRVLVGFNF